MRIKTCLLYSVLSAVAAGGATIVIQRAITPVQRVRPARDVDTSNKHRESTWADIDIGERDRRVIFILDDPSLIQDLIEDPIKNAIIDTHPKRWEVIGKITVNGKHLRHKHYALFTPFGKIKAEGNVYLTCNLEKLREYCKRVSGYATGQ